MHRLHFSIDIAAKREIVWKVLWDRDTFREWTDVFTEGSGEGASIHSVWLEGGRFEFFEGKRGSYGVIEQISPPASVSFKHLGEINDGKEFSYERPRFENYLLEQRGNITTLSLMHDVPDEHKAMFEGATPQALQKIKKLCEGVA